MQGVLVQSEAQLCVTAAYIARNPPAAKLCGGPEAWPWSSYGVTISGNAPSWLSADRLLSHFGSEREVARRAFGDLVAWQL